MDATPKIACLRNGPYYLLNDMRSEAVPNLRRASAVLRRYAQPYRL